MADRPFTVIDGTPAPDTPQERRLQRLRDSTPAVLVQCPRCTGNAIIERKLGMVRTRKGAKPSGGNKQWICGSICLSKGLITVIDF